MKKIFYFFAIVFCSFLASCSDDDDEVIMTYAVNVQLNYGDVENADKEKVHVILTSTTGVAYEALTNAEGIAAFNVPIGIYRASASERITKDGFVYNFNGVKDGITVTAAWTGKEVTYIDMVASRSGQIIIKELYNGGVMKDDGSGNYQFDKYVVLYNNSDEVAQVSNFCLGMVNPYNAEAASAEYVDGKLSYADKGYIPAGCGFWYLSKDFILQPGKEAVIALCGAIDHTVTYKNSVDLSHADYCTYDMDNFDNPNYYPAPSENIAEENYFKACKYGMGNAWPLSVVSPAFYIFSTEGVSPQELGASTDLHYAPGREGKAAFACAKVKTEWILDGIEVFSAANLDKAMKRLTPAVDAGQVALTNFAGHSLYRNVDKAATEAIESNNGKLVYNYSFGIGETTDPSGIDAEASLRNGARIVYQDTNNSSKDFHERKQASLKD